MDGLMSNRLRWLILGVMALAAAVLSWSVANLLIGGGGSAGSVNRALIGGPFHLTDHRGRPVEDKQFRGKLMLVYFGYTYCPDVCPTELQNMSNALDLLGDKVAQVQPLFITVDPARDTVEHLAGYMESFHKAFLGLTGTKEEVAGAAKAYRVYYARAKGTGNPKDPKDETYLVDHSGFVYLMSREGQYVAHFAPNAEPQKIAQAIRQHL
jgi:cytochrome oxidase Cu insertion factor (SCO1/SenC/PrrC family)